VEPLIATIHQPEHLPWLGFFNKMDQADVFVLLDNVPFRTNYFQNRNRILGAEGPMWLTVPVEHSGHLERPMHSIAISSDVSWRRKHWRSISQSYSRHRYFAEHAEFFESLYGRMWSRLTELNEEIIGYLIRALGIRIQLQRASDLGVEGTSTRLLLNICERVGARTYLAGQSAPQYLDAGLFEAAGVSVRYHEFEHPRYLQRNRGEFVSHLSTIDLLFNCGPESLSVIRSGSQRQQPSNSLSG
jgi:hypothetical protein